MALEPLLTYPKLKGKDLPTSVLAISNGNVVLNRKNTTSIAVIGILASIRQWN